MKNVSPIFALKLLLGLLWPLIAGAGLAVALSGSRLAVAWALLALLIVATVVRIRPLFDVALAAAAAVVFVIADALGRVADNDGLLDGMRPLALLATVVILLLTPAVQRLLMTEWGGLLTRLREQSLRIDQLTMRGETGVFRSHFLDLILDEEAGRAHRYRRALSVGVVTIDGWAELAEEAAEEGSGVRGLMRTVEEQLRAVSRSTDKVVEMEPGEWAIIWPETAVDGARTVATRIQRALEDDLNLPAYIGLADFPRDATTGADLLRAARQASAFARSARLPVVDRVLAVKAG